MLEYSVTIRSGILKFTAAQTDTTIEDTISWKGQIMVHQLHRTYYRNKKSVRDMYYVLALSVAVFVFSPGWVYIQGWHF